MSAFVLKLPGYREEDDVFIGTVPLMGALDVACKVFRVSGNSASDTVSLHATTDTADSAVTPYFVSSNSTTLSNLVLDGNFTPQLVTLRLQGQYATRGVLTSRIMLSVQHAGAEAYQVRARVAVSKIGVPMAVRVAFEAHNAASTGVISVTNTSSTPLRLRPSIDIASQSSLRIGMYHESCCFMEELNYDDTSHAFVIPAGTTVPFHIRLATDHDLLPGHSIVPVQFYALDGPSDDRTTLLHVDILEDVGSYTTTVAEQTIANDVVATTVGLGGSSQIVYDGARNRIRFLVGGRDQPLEVASAPTVETAESCVRLGINSVTGDLEITRTRLENGGRVSDVLLRVDASDGRIRVKSGLIVTDSPDASDASDAFALRTGSATGKSTMQIVGPEDHVLWEVGPVDDDEYAASSGNSGTLISLEVVEADVVRLASSAVQWSETMGWVLAGTMTRRLSIFETNGMVSESAFPEGHLLRLTDAAGSTWLVEIAGQVQYQYIESLSIQQLAMAGASDAAVATYSIGTDAVVRASSSIRDETPTATWTVDIMRVL